MFVSPNLLEKPSSLNFFQDKIVKRIYLIYLAVFIYTWLYLSPGTLAFDVYIQLLQMLNQHFDDWHPTAFIFMWSLLYPIFGMKSMLFVQLFAWFGSFALFTHIIYLRCHFGKLWHWLLLLAILLFSPYSLLTIGSVVKDTQMFYSMLLVFTILTFLYLINLHQRLCRLLLALALLFLAYVVNLRHFGFIIAWPLVVLWVYIFAKTERICWWNLGVISKSASWKGWFLRAILGFFLALFLFLGYRYTVDKLLLSTKFVRASPQIAMMDIFGTYYHSIGSSALPNLLFHNPKNKAAALKKLDSVYNVYPLNGDSLAYLDLLKMPGDLYRLWIKTILNHPMGYLKHRLRFSYELLFFKAYVGAMISNDNFAASRFLHNKLYETLEQEYSWIKNDVFANPKDSMARMQEFYKVLNYEVERLYNSTLVSFRYPFRHILRLLHSFEEKLMFNFSFYTPIVLGMVYLLALFYALSRRFLLTFFLSLQALWVLFCSCMTISIVHDMRYWSFIYIASSALVLTLFIEIILRRRGLKISN